MINLKRDVVVITVDYLKNGQVISSFGNRLSFQKYECPLRCSKTVLVETCSRCDLLGLRSTAVLYKYIRTCNDLLVRNICIDFSKKTHFLTKNSFN